MGAIPVNTVALRMYVCMPHERKQTQATQQNKQRDTITLHDINSMACTRSGKYLITVGNCDSMKQWSIRQKRFVHSYENEDEGYIKEIMISADDDHIFSIGRLGGIKLWWISGRCLVKNLKSETTNSVITIASDS